MDGSGLSTNAKVIIGAAAVGGVVVAGIAAAIISAASSAAAATAAGGQWVHFYKNNIIFALNSASMGAFSVESPDIWNEPRTTFKSY